MKAKDNKLIAEFMELPTEVFNTGLLNYYHREHNSGTWYEEHELSYNVSWDWLMPVVQKIERLGYVFTIQGGKEDKLSSTYNAVVEFIKTHETRGANNRLTDESS